MRRSGLQGVTGRRKWKRIRPDHRHRPRRAQLHPGQTQPAVGHRHHRAPEQGRQGLLLRRAGHVLTTGRGLVHRRLTHRRTGHQRFRDGHRHPAREDRKPRCPSY
ncbi:MAG: hypothetical protein WKG07_00075, partial [Hymenobacter sp.]